jgi:uncharacterized membrane protein YedE/YeeE
MDIIETLSRPWPWWISGPLLGLMVPVLLLAGNKEFGISSTFRHLCAMVTSKPAYLKYDWKKQGGWQLALALGVVAGGWLAAAFFGGARMPALTVEARQLFQSWGVALDSSGYQPDFLARWSEAWSARGLVSLVFGGFLVGFGTRWANGCTSGHAIMGLSLLSGGSLVATLGFFAGGTLASWLLVPVVLGL